MEAAGSISYVYWEALKTPWIIGWNVFGLSTSSIVIGYKDGTILIKIGQEVPVASMDSSGKIVWA